MATARSRLWEVDAARGVAVVLMIFFHLMWDLPGAQLPTPSHLVTVQRHVLTMTLGGAPDYGQPTPGAGAATAST
ncbi:MAG: DUF1624 domain-containing protein [Chloroflexales bacterium]|nr:DUF1624 domain-containing protein [Chloroflexales bacterium]